MYRSIRVLSALLCCAAMAAAGCGDDGGNNVSDATVVFIDAPIPDAPTPDAYICNMTDCGNNQCVDLQTDEFHCGNCTTVCDNGQECVSGGCQCPTVTPPANPAGIFEQIDTTTVPGIALGLTAFLAGNGADAMVVIYDPATQVTNMDLDISTLGLTPGVLYGYNVDIGAMSVQTAYIATEGTLNFGYACATGVEATLTDVTFSQVSSLTDPTPLPGGCTFTAASIHVVLGDPCVSGVDAGVPTVDGGAGP